ncbi:DUF3187 family protein [Enterovibrio sp. ZSDZ35]|uniref:DUF3187 family protein n=1 Tax=Enterovibrio qingdaonensis TaxID=2899818 RepID=A0ABT5QMD6_9GAMM|nr:DUF3187 family protein [Enterovibrio sp. ZSDZ35]MDD1782143.1 DUF3187 family protein [Enterovibrio sp. ZSDZ35]
MALSRTALVCLFTLLGFSYPTNADTVRFGPLIAQSQAPLQVTGLAPMMHDPMSLATDETEVFASLTIASVWANTPDYLFDYYHNQIMAGFMNAPSETTKIGVWYQYRYAANNRLDGLTEKFHSIFGIDQNGRTEVDEDRFYIHIPNDMAEPIEGFGGDPLLSAFSLYGEKTLYHDEHHAISVGATLFFNRVSHGVFTNTTFEQAMQVNYGYQRDKHKLTASLGLTHRPDKPQHFVDVKPWGINAGVSYQYALLKHHELIAEYLISQGKGDNDNLGELTSLVHEFALGYRYLFDDSAIELMALENMFNHDNSTDIVFSATFRHRLTL